MVFGISELENNEPVESKVFDLLERLEENSKIRSCSRIGQQKSGTTRPIRIRVQNPAIVHQILQKAGKLKDIDGYKTINLSPDRTLEERNTRRELVNQLKKKRTSDPDNHYQIRNGQILCSS